MKPWTEKLNSAQIFAFLIILSFSLWISGIVIYREPGSQFDLFFLHCRNFLADATNVTGYSSCLDPYHDIVKSPAEKSYPALTYCLMYPLSRVCHITKNYLILYQQPSFLIMIIITIVIQMITYFAVMNIQIAGTNLIKYFLSIALCISQPFLFTIERGNTILLCSLLCMCFIFYYDNPNKLLRELSYISLAIAAALKITPAIFGILLLYDRKYKEAFRTIIYGIFMMFVPFLLLKGGLSNVPLMLNNMKANLSLYSDLDGCGLTASFQKYMTLNNSNYTMGSFTHRIIRLITYMITLLLLSSSPLSKNKWERVLRVTIVLLILPTHSGKYCTIYLIPTMILFLNSNKKNIMNSIIFIGFVLICWDHISLISKICNYNLAVPLLAFVCCYSSIIEIYSSYKAKKCSRSGI